VIAEVRHEIEDLDEVLPVEDNEDLDYLEEVEDSPQEIDEVPALSSLSWSRLLQMPFIFVCGQKGSLLDGITKQDHARYDLIDPETRRKVAMAEEVRDGANEAIRFLAGRTLMNTFVEIREGRAEDLLATIRRPAYLFGASLEIFDPNDELLGQFERSPWLTMMNKPIWISSKGGRKLLKIQPRFASGRCVFSLADGREVGEMMTESAYERKIKIRWFSRGGSYYIRFSRALDHRCREKLLFIAAALGIDLFQEEQMKR
jgi:hypothetical protein